MGKRSGVTKSGRVMNPADRERKQMRLKELKRNKKERVKVRHTIVKSRDPQDLIEKLERLDDQEFDPDNQLSMNVINDKRGKFRGAFIQMIALYRTEKNDKEIKRLETMLHDYELERFQKEQHYKALLFSQKADPDEIPLPSGSEPPPNAASTPFAPPPVAPHFHPTMKAGILKKSALPTTKKHKYPPGPPCGLPPSLSDDEDEEPLESRRSRKVKFSEPRIEDDEEFDYAPVEIPESMFMQEQLPPQSQPVYQRMPIRVPGVPIPPGMAPPPPRMAPYGSGYPLHPSAMPEMHSQSMRDRERRPGQPSGSNRIPLPDEPNTAAVISAGPQVIKPTVDVASSEPVISAAPQMRNLKKETTKFVPTSLRIPRPNPSQAHRKAPTHHGAAMISANIKAKASNAAATGKSTDEACDDFLREIQGLL